MALWHPFCQITSSLRSPDKQRMRLAFIASCVMYINWSPNSTLTSSRKHGHWSTRWMIFCQECQGEKSCTAQEMRLKSSLTFYSNCLIAMTWLFEDHAAYKIPDHISVTTTELLPKSCSAMIITLQSRYCVYLFLHNLPFSILPFDLLHNTMIKKNYLLHFIFLFEYPNFKRIIWYLPWG
jgi:hypothetical protein